MTSFKDVFFDLRFGKHRHPSLDHDDGVFRIVAANESGSDFNIDRFSMFIPLRSEEVISPRTCTVKFLGRGVTKLDGIVVTKHTETFSATTISGRNREQIAVEAHRYLSRTTSRLCRSSLRFSIP